jgi:hypothetical protein
MPVFSVAAVQPPSSDPIVSPALMDPESTPGKKGQGAVGVEGFAEEFLPAWTLLRRRSSDDDRNREEGLTEL